MADNWNSSHELFFSWSLFLEVRLRRKAAPAPMGRLMVNGREVPGNKDSCTELEFQVKNLVFHSKSHYIAN